VRAVGVTYELLAGRLVLLLELGEPLLVDCLIGLLRLHELLLLLLALGGGGVGGGHLGGGGSRHLGHCKLFAQPGVSSVCMERATAGGRIERSWSGALAYM